MKKEMLINCLQPEEIRIAILENGVLEELYVERASHESYVGNIYKGRVVNIEPSIQAAFIDFGVGRNGFLHVSDVEPAYYREIEQPTHGRRGDRPGWGKPQRNYDDYDAPRRREPRPGPPPREDEPRGFADEIERSAPAFPAHPYDVSHDGGEEIIVEQLVDDDDDDFIPAQPAEAAIPGEAEPQPDWPIPAEAYEEPGFDDSPPPTAEPLVIDMPEEATEDVGIEAEPQGEEAKEGADEEKPRRKGARQPKGRTPRARKPRKRAGDATEPALEEPTAGETPAPEPPQASDQPRPRPMDSSEHRTSADDPSHGPIEPRPSASDLTDDDLSFSKSPPPPLAAARPRSETSPVERAETPSPVERMELAEEIIVEEEIFEDEDDFGAGPMQPAIPKIDPDESIEELVEEEKALEEEENLDGAPAVSEGDAGARPAPDLDDEFGDVESFMPRPRGGQGRGRGGRGDRDRDRRGGGGSSGRGGRDRDRRGPRTGGARPGIGRPKPHIEDIFKRGQEVLVQVIKEGIGTKGPTLSTYISIAGRYLVLMPGLNRIGVSRKIEDEETRRRLREIMNELRPPKGLGFIIRTAGQDRNREELQSDLAYLSRLWQVVVRRIKKQKSPTEIYKESDMVTRTIRDIFTSDIDTIWVDERGAYEAAKEFMEAVMPRYADRIKFYDGTAPMFHKYGIESEIARIQERKISLPHGGSIVIDQTEALVAIDVNSGNFRADNNNAEETAYQMNLQAAKEIARQLRLRDLGGVIANDFIDMRDERHRRGVEKALRDAVQRDRARSKILRISQFGIIEMTRQRIRPSLKRSAFQECPHCHGTGNVKTGESVSIEVMRMLQLAINRVHIARVEVRVHDEVAQYLLNQKRKEIVALEEQGKKQVAITGAGSAVSPEFLEFQCLDNNGNEVKFTVVDEPVRPPQRRRGR